MMRVCGLLWVMSVVACAQADAGPEVVAEAEVFVPGEIASDETREVIAEVEDTLEVFDDDAHEALDATAPEVIEDIERVAEPEDEVVEVVELVEAAPEIAEVGEVEDVLVTDLAETIEVVPEVEASAETTDTTDTIDPTDVHTPSTPPLVTYTLGGARRLLFLNNPEQLIDADLGDATLGDKTLYRATVNGANRSFYEHVNRTNRTVGFGIQVYNPGPASVRVDVVAAGWVVGILGGAPFADALGGAGDAAEVVLDAGRSTWIVRHDDQVPAGAFFSGVVDFDVSGGAVIVNHIAYDNFAALDGSTSELGYVQRIEPDGTHEARMYKGIASASETTLGPLDVTLDDDLPAGPVPVHVARFDRTRGEYANPIIATEWTTHIGPAQNANATASDMVSFDYADWRFSVWSDSDGEARPANLGNWGIVYSARVRVDNRGTRARRIAYVVRASPGAGAVIASRNTGAWSSRRLEKGTTFELGAVVVPAGEVRELSVQWVLGGPSGGGIANHLVVD